MTERRYSEKEVREILARAAEDSGSRALQSPQGMTLAELKDIGVEVGIDPASVERAARSVGTDAPAHYGGLFGVPRALNRQRTVAVELDPEIMPELVAVIRNGMGRSGELAEVHGMVEWRASGDGGERVISMAGRGGTTTVQGTADLRTAVTLAYLPTGIIGTTAAIGAAVSASQTGNATGLFVGLGIVSLALLGVRALLRRYVRGEERRIETVVDELGRAILAAAPPDEE